MNSEKNRNDHLLPAVVEQPEAEQTEKKKRTLQEMDQQASDVIVACTAAATATCALPLPFADAPLLIAEQTAMLATLCGVYEINMEKEALSSLLWGVIGVSGTTIVGKTIFTSLMKMIPGFGTAAGGIAAAATGGTLTAALGKAWCILCKDVLSGSRDVSDLAGKDGIQLLSTTFQNQLRLEMKKTNDNDVLSQQPVPEDDQIIEMAQKEPKQKQEDN